MSFPALKERKTQRRIVVTARVIPNAGKTREGMVRVRTPPKEGGDVGEDEKN